MANQFMFCTGIENSYPTIAGGLRVDEMEKCDHYRRYKEDLGLVREMGIEFLRYGPPLHRCFVAPGRYDWSFWDDAMEECRRLNITVIADLCHFGLPDWLGNFQNPEWPSYFAEYAAEFAGRYPDIWMYTPVNEIFIAATFSGLYGWWNERLASHETFVQALKTLSMANVLAMGVISSIRPNSIFIQSESSEYFHPETPDAQPFADFHNERRFLSLDLTYGHDVTARMYQYLLDNGMTRDEYAFFMNQCLRVRCIMGNDYYITNEHIVNDQGRLRSAGEILGYYVITKQYHERYRLPVMHTETNRFTEEAVTWLWKQWVNMLRLKRDGVPITGFTWYSLTDQVDWDTALRENNNRVNTLGLYDMDRKIRPVGEAYRKLIEQWRDLLPQDSAYLDPKAGWGHVPRMS
jgi:beta-glucosidase/6-phospho-beta-glucosidase/beta-galactosidase